MPIYEYACEGCRVVYEVLQRLNDAPLGECPRCRRAVRRQVSAPRLNTGNFSSPTEARYARMSITEEVKREQVLQRSYETLPFPPGVKHDPGEH